MAPQHHVEAAGASSDVALPAAGRPDGRGRLPGQLRKKPGGACEPIASDALEAGWGGHDARESDPQGQTPLYSGGHSSANLHPARLTPVDQSARRDYNTVTPTSHSAGQSAAEGGNPRLLL
ncbi:unnamed protein product [Lampetra planeri]